MQKKTIKEIIRPPKGMHDILPEEHRFYNAIYEKMDSIAEYYGFKQFQTPYLEHIEIFTSTLGETTDIVEKEMYTLKTKGKDHLVLRPEGTASIMRAYISNGMHTKPQPVMLSYKGSFFRHEKPQKGRFREFQQFGLEIIGEEKSFADALIIKIFSIMIEELGIEPFTVHVNSIGDKECRPAYRKELVAYYRKHLNYICKDCRSRIKTNPLRLLDCKEEKCQEVKKEAPQMMEFLCTGCQTHFKETLEMLDSFEVPYIIDHTLVRGLDYYTRTVFEILTDVKKGEEEDLSKLALCGGGRYDGLAKFLAKKDIPGVGGSFGIERIIKVMKERKVKLKPKKKPKLFFVQIGQAAKLKSIPMLEQFRKAGLAVGQSFGKGGLSDQLKLASKQKIPYAIILGQKEALEGTVIIRNMENYSQETVSADKIVDIIKKKIK